MDADVKTVRVQECVTVRSDVIKIRFQDFLKIYLPSKKHLGIIFVPRCFVTFSPNIFIKTQIYLYNYN